MTDLTLLHRATRTMLTHTMMARTQSGRYPEDYALEPARAISRWFVPAGSAVLLASPAIIGRASAATRGVSDTPIIIGTMADLSGVTAVQAFTAKYRKTFGIDVNYLGEAGYTASTCVIPALEKAARDLTLDSFIGTMGGMKGWHHIVGGPAPSMSAANHHASSQSFLFQFINKRWTPVMEEPLSF